MKRIAIAALALIAVSVMALPATAQVNLADERLGSLYVSGAEDRQVTTIDGNVVAVNIPFDVFVVADIDFADIGAGDQNLTNGISAWEGAFTVPAPLLVISEVFFPAGALNFGSVSGSVREYIIGTGSTLTVGGPTKLIQWSVLLSGAPGLEFDDTITVAPVAAPSTPGEVVWVEDAPLNGCEVNGNPAGCIFRFESLGDLRVTTAISGDDSSFGALKSRF